MTYKLYGIPNCDTVKKARKFLDKSNIDYEFVDFKKTAPKASWIKEWKKHLGELPVNKRGTTFRKIKDAFEDSSESNQIKLLVENSSSIKRPILESRSKTLAVGFAEEEWKKIIK